MGGAQRPEGITFWLSGGKGWKIFFMAPRGGVRGEGGKGGGVKTEKIPIWSRGGKNLTRALTRQEERVKSQFFSSGGKIFEVQGGKLALMYAFKYKTSFSGTFSLHIFAVRSSCSQSTAVDS